MNPYSVILPANPPKFIQVADKPLNLGGKIESLTLAEFEKHFNCTYNDGISVNLKAKITSFEEYITGNTSKSHLKAQVNKILETACDSLVLCNMDKLGYGLFASKAIPKDTVLAIYSGTIFNGSKVSDQHDEALSYNQSEMSFSTMHYRGIASFMQHLPKVTNTPDVKELYNRLKSFDFDFTEEDLKLRFEFYSTEFNSKEVKAAIATENIRLEFLNMDNIPVIAMVTDENIAAGSPLGFNYGYFYWSSRKMTPEFIDKNGEVISHKYYKKTFGQLNFDEFMYTGEYQPLVDSLNQKQSSIKIWGDDKKFHDVSSSKLRNILCNAHIL